MKEDFLQYVWSQRLFYPDLRTGEGEEVRVLNVGQLNRGDGPDFFNAKIQIGNLTWVGNVEIHDKASDWYKHRHDMDTSYDSVVLHVVEKSDMEVRRPSGEIIPQVTLRIPQGIVARYGMLCASKQTIACAEQIGKTDPAVMRSVLDCLVMERMECKTNAMKRMLERTGGDWREAFYELLARGLGFGTNAEGMEALARSLPLSVIGKHKDNSLQVEALLMGQAGLIERYEKKSPQRAERLRMEYGYLRHKFDLVPLSEAIWKFKTRPDNSPLARIATLAHFVKKMDGMLTKLIEQPTIENAFGMFDIRDTEETLLPPQRMGRDSMELLIINAVVPSLFLYGRLRNKEALCERAIEMLSQLGAERNTIVRQFGVRGVKAENAADSQALIELKTEYCDKRKCLRCRLSRSVLCEGEEIFG